MEHQRRRNLVYSLLVGVWFLVVAWQCEEHFRVVNAAKADLRNRAREISSTLSAVMRALRFRGAIGEDRLEPVMDELINVRTNVLVSSSGLISIVLLNTANEPVVSAGQTNLVHKENLSGGEYWTSDTVTFVNPVEGASVSPEGTNNHGTVVLPSFRDFTNNLPHDARDFSRDHDHGSHPPDADNSTNPPPSVPANAAGTNAVSGQGEPPPPPDEGRSHNNNRGRPPWLRWMSEDDFKALIARRELHGLVLVMSTENVRAAATSDLWLRAVIVFFAGISAFVAGFAWRNTLKNADLQIRLVRASELNSHLKEMNLAAAGLAHETRNPLNIIRGLAQMLSRQTDAPPEIREKSRVILDETDKVTSQLTEFINYSRPREVRRVRVALNSAVAEVLRTLAGDIEENKIQVATHGEALNVEADEQMLRQVLFNLLINAIQATGAGGDIQVHVRRTGAAGALVEVRDNGPGVPLERRQEIFKPYFTTHQKGTGLGLAVVQQMVLAHGWEIACLANEPKGAVFRISHLKIVA